MEISKDNLAVIVSC